MKEGRKKSGYPEKIPGDVLQKMPHNKTRKFKPHPIESRTRTLALVADKESRRASRFTTHWSCSGHSVSAGTGWTGVSVLGVDDTESLICNFHLSVASCTTV